MATEVKERNTALAREYLEWQRKRNRARETIYIYTQVLQKLLDWIDDTPLGAAHISALESFVDRPRLRRR